MVYHKTEWWRENKLVIYDVILVHNYGEVGIIYESRWIIVKKYSVYAEYSVYLILSKLLIT